MERRKKVRGQTKKWRVAAALLVCTAVFTVSILPAAAVEADKIVCGREEHTHTEDCYEERSVLACPKTEEEDHVHDEACYETESVLACGREEHVHTEECYISPEEENGSGTNDMEEEENNSGTIDAEEENGGGTDDTEENTGMEDSAAGILDEGTAEVQAASFLAAGTGAKSAGIVESADSSGFIVNLFDYWVREDNINPVTHLSSIGDNKDGNRYTEGINHNHALKFVVYYAGNNYSKANLSSGSEVRQGIVANKLEKGYPVLAGKGSIWNTNTENCDVGESLAYLFDPSYEEEYRETYPNVTGLFQIDEEGYYYYNSQENFAELDREAGTFRLYDTWGVKSVDPGTPSGQFFPFNTFSVSANNTMVSTEINHYFGLTLTTRFAQQNGGYIDEGQNKAMTFEFSGDDDVWIFIDDVLVGDLGGLRYACSVSIDFSTGEVHITNANNTKIGTSLYEQYKAAGAEDTVKWTTGSNGEMIFADGTYHTLKFFFLERGNGSSNLNIKTNLVSYPSTSIYKVDQYGETVEGAAFAVYAADENYNLLSDRNGQQVTLPEAYAYDLTPGSENYGSILDSGGNVTARALYTGVTNENGEMIFLDEDGMPYALKELQDMFGDYFILKEIAVPEGYRLVNDDIHLYIYNDTVLMCANTYESGVYSSAALQVTAPKELKPLNGTETVKYITTDSNGDLITDGTLFAVVLKYTGPDAGNASEDDLADPSNWAPVYGNSVDGFAIVDVDRDYGGNFIAAAIATAGKYTESQNVFDISSGQAVAQINGLPGDITTYYYMLDDNSRARTQYSVAYYYSTAPGLSEADSENTVRIDADAPGHAFTRTFGATIEVPNLLNRLLVQKLDSEGNLIDGASFAIYEVEEEAGTIYYVGHRKESDGTETKTLIYLAPDDGSGDDEKAGDNTGSAHVIEASDMEGTYRIDSTTGTITAEFVSGGSTVSYEIAAVDVQETIGAEDKQNTSGEDGTASFINLSEGKYIVREISAPEGYLLNTSEVLVRITDDAVLVNAGTADDGVTVARGAGYVVSTLNQFASAGEIDNTLTWIYGQLKVTGESAGFAETTKESYYNADGEDSWHYITENYWDGDEGGLTSDREDAVTSYLTYNTGGGANTIFNYSVNTDRDGKNASGTRRLYTDVGWSYMEIYQDHEYGAGHAADQAAYTDLNKVVDSNGDGAPDGMIANLFSRSAYIQVLDEREPGILNISKTVKNKNGSTMTDDNTEFLFTITLTGPGGKELIGTYPYDVYMSDDTEQEPAAGGGTISSGGSITLKNGQTAAIALPNGTRYEVTEEHTDHYSAAAVRDAARAVNDESDGAGKMEFSGESASGAVIWEETDDTDEEARIFTLDYTNTYQNDDDPGGTPSGNKGSDDGGPSAADASDMAGSRASGPLPQTGQLNWPVLVLAPLGLLLFIIGWIRYFRRNGQ